MKTLNFGLKELLLRQWQVCVPSAERQDGLQNELLLTIEGITILLCVEDGFASDTMGNCYSNSLNAIVIENFTSVRHDGRKVQ